MRRKFGRSSGSTASDMVKSISLGRVRNFLAYFLCGGSLRDLVWGDPSDSEVVVGMPGGECTGAVNSVDIPSVEVAEDGS